MAADFEKNAVETYKANFPNTPVFYGDVTNLTVDKILEITGLKFGELDIFDGSPPCQGFSTTGKRDMADNRNQLFNEYVRILKGLQPKCFVMENVSGMVKGNMKFIFVEILKSLKACGYKVKAKILNAKNFGVAQSRQRLIFIGVREDLGIEPSHPEGSTKLITVRQALKDCPNGKRLPVTGFTAKVIHKMKQGQKASDYHPKGSFFSNYRIEWDAPCCTIRKECARGPLYHPEIDATLSIEELKRLSSFPDNFIFMGNFSDQWARIGNCVPPNFMKAIAIHINENILKQIDWEAQDAKAKTR